MLTSLGPKTFSSKNLLDQFPVCFLDSTDALGGAVIQVGDPETDCGNGKGDIHYVRPGIPWTRIKYTQVRQIFIKGTYVCVCPMILVSLSSLRQLWVIRLALACLTKVEPTWRLKG